MVVGRSRRVAFLKQNTMQTQPNDPCDSPTKTNASCSITVRRQFDNIVLTAGNNTYIIFMVCRCHRRSSPNTVYSRFTAHKLCRVRLLFISFLFLQQHVSKYCWQQEERYLAGKERRGRIDKRQKISSKFGWKRAKRS